MMTNRRRETTFDVEDSLLCQVGPEIMKREGDGD